MAFKCGPGEFSKYLSINLLAEIVKITNELKVCNIQVIANDFLMVSIICVFVHRL